jgi:ABC-type multidrug transport system fused ATPase/permease subunit
MVPRFYDPASGTVRLDGIDLRELRLQDLRAQVAVVFQESILLPGTVGQNIALGQPDAVPAQVEAAARAAGAHDFIQRLPNKYDTIVGEGAARLSVGEVQRIGLARAFLKDAPILLLDEPTSALDEQSERQIMSSLGELMRGRTTLIVAHRLRTIRGVDKIVVLDQGRVIEEGAPEELLRRSGSYYARLEREDLA